MAKEKKVRALFGSIAAIVFILYILLSAQPVPRETVLRNVWLKDLETEAYNAGDASEEAAAPTPGVFVAPFRLGKRFGYADAKGNLLLNRKTENAVSLSSEYWAEFENAPKEIVVHKSTGSEPLTLSPAPGYPIFLDGRILFIGKGQSTLSEYSEDGKLLWQYDFDAPLTTLDAAGGRTLAGMLDGKIELLGGDGRSIIHSYQLSGSRILVVAGCRISQDGSKIAVVSGIDRQRFLFLERYGSDDYRFTHPEHLKGEGFRREVHLAIVNGDATAVFETQEGLGVYDVKSPKKNALVIPFKGTIAALDNSGESGILFIIVSENAGNKKLVGITLPGNSRGGGRVLLEAPFKSDDVFLSRRGNEICIGGKSTLAFFRLESM